MTKSDGGWGRKPGGGTNRRPLTKKEILRAQRHTRSAMEAARWIGCSYETYRKYAILYGIHEQHINMGGKGIPRPNSKGKRHSLTDIIAGKYPNYDTRRLKKRLITAGYLDEQCSICGFKERRITDYRVPLILNFKEIDVDNIFALNNMMVLCFNCFSRDTRFVTSEGVKSFEDFSNGDRIVVLTHKGNWKSAIVKSFGKQELQEVTIIKTRSIYKIKTTPNHRWILKDGSKTTQLKVGDMLLSAPPIFDEFDYNTAPPSERLYWAYGYVFGDGSVVDKNGKYPRSMVRLCKREKQKYLYRFRELGFPDSTSHSLAGDVMVYTGTYAKTVPDSIKDCPSLIRAFVRGYLDADGEKSKRIYSKFDSIVATGKDHQYVVEQLFPIAGVFISSFRDISGQETNYGIRGNSKHYCISTNLYSPRPQDSFIVKNIETKIGSEEVWCLEVEDDASFVLVRGISTGNCTFLTVGNLNNLNPFKVRRMADRLDDEAYKGDDVEISDIELEQILEEARQELNEEVNEHGSK